MATITLSRQLGSLGLDVARQTAARLGYRLVWRDLINEAARRAGAPEVALAAIDDLGLFKLCPSDEACHAYHAAIRQVMEELAGQGNVVIAGRAGQVILHERPAVLHVRVIAPLDLRIQRVAQRFSITPNQAAAQIRASDKSRRNYLQKFYAASWDEPELYDLTMNTARFTPDDAAELIAAAIARLPAHLNPPLDQYESTHA